MHMQASHPVRVQNLQVLGKAARVHIGGVGKRTLLLLHGGWGDAELHWSRVWDALGQHFRVIAPDLPGLGDLSQLGRANLADYVKWLDALLVTLAVPEVVCVGNSFGASLALSFAGRAPQRCLGVVVVDGVPMPRTPAPLLRLGRMPPGRALMRQLVNRVSFTAKLLPRAFAKPDRAPAALRAGLTAAPERRLATFVDCLIAGDGPPPPHVPVLVLWGEADHLPGTGLAQGRKVAAALPGSRFKALADAGHFPQLEQPMAFATAVGSFANKLPELRHR